MVELPRSPDSDDDAGGENDHGSINPTPHWVKVFGIIALAVVLVFVILLITGGSGGHGPGRH